MYCRVLQFAKSPLFAGQLLGTSAAAGDKFAVSALGELFVVKAKLFLDQIAAAEAVVAA